MALNLEQAQVANAWHEKVREGKKEEEIATERNCNVSITVPILTATT